MFFPQDTTRKEFLDKEPPSLEDSLNPALAGVDSLGNLNSGEFSYTDGSIGPIGYLAADQGTAGLGGSSDFLQYDKALQLFGQIKPAYPRTP